MKIFQKVFISLIIVICILINIIPIVSKAEDEETLESMINNFSAEEINNSSYTNLKDIISRILGFLQAATGLISIIMIATTGFNYIVSTPNVKKDLKDKMLPIIIGLVITFSAVSITQFILGAVE